MNKIKKLQYIEDLLECIKEQNFKISYLYMKTCSKSKMTKYKNQVKRLEKLERLFNYKKRKLFDEIYESPI